MFGNQLGFIEGAASACQPCQALVTCHDRSLLLQSGCCVHLSAPDPSLYRLLCLSGVHGKASLFLPVSHHGRQGLGTADVPSDRWYQWFKILGILLGAGGAIVMTVAKSGGAKVCLRLLASVLVLKAFIPYDLPSV